MGLLIQDGFTLDGILPNRPGLHGEIRFKYRPALSERVSGYLKGIASFDNETKLVADHLAEVEGEGELNNTLGIKDKTEAVKMLKRVPYPDIQVMIDHITCYRSTDWSEREKN